MYPLNLPDPEWARAVFLAVAAGVAGFCAFWMLLVRIPARLRGRGRK